MIADEWVKQYHAKAITARELVGGVWNWIVVDIEDSGVGYNLSSVHQRARFFTKKEALLAAADFTISRIEEIRQVKEEIALLRGLVILLNEEPGDLSTPAWLRVITREQSALAELSRGIRPEAL